MDAIGATRTALEEITKLIMTHEYKPGDRILETTLARRLNMSRTPIRDAISRLVSTGFLEKPEGQKGYQIPSLTPQDMKLVFETRALLEGQAARLAAGKRTEEDLRTLTELNEKEIEAFYKKERESYAVFNQTLHFTLAGMAQNPYLYRYIEQVFWRSLLYIFFFAEFYSYDQDLRTYRREHQRLSHQEHGKLISAIAEGNGGEAERLMREHISKTYQHLLNPKSYMEPQLDVAQADQPEGAAE